MKKLKRQYRLAVKIEGINTSGSVYRWDYYPCMRNVMDKNFSTKQEKSYYYLHKIECKEYPIKLRSARGKALADPWDDYPAHVVDLAKCWKHNSKRRRQYYK